jgi:hypothetical protein
MPQFPGRGRSSTEVRRSCASVGPSRGLRARTWAFVGAVCVVSACGGHAIGSTRGMTNALCERGGDDSIVAAAVTGFLNQSDPEPGFLVYIPATDSTPPPAAVQEMQNRRTTYMYSSDPTQQATVDKKIASYGDYDVLLVAYHGITKTDPLHPVVTFSGHYTGGAKVRGHTLGPLRIAPQCDSTGSWSVPSQPKAPAATPQPPTPASASSSAPRAG